MKTCSHCARSNHSDAKYCAECGNWIGNAKVKEAKKSFFSRIPSWLTALIILAAGLAFIAFNILLVVSVSTFEGLASLIFFGIGILVFVAMPLRYRKTKAPGFSPTGIFLVFFAVMGAAIDQTGNVVYNEPIEWCGCPDNTSLNRTLDVIMPHPGKTIYSQDFTCYDRAGKAVEQIHMLWILFIRFLEYLLIGILLIGFQRTVHYFLEKREHEA